MTKPIHVTLDDLLRAPRRKVVAQAVTEHGVAALRVEPAPGLTMDDLIDKPTFVVVPVPFKNGVIEVDVSSRTAPDAPPIARGFAGLAYRITAEATAFESVYLRPLNGRALKPPPPRDKRAVQYFAYPDWHYERLRADFPDGTYEAGADIQPDTWISLKLEIRDQRVTATVDGQQVLSVDGRVPASEGSVGLWVDIGTIAFFRNLRISPSA